MCIEPKGEPHLSIYSTGTGREQRLIRELVYMESELNYTWLYWADGQRILVPYSLKHMSARLPKDSLIRIHRRLAVNPVFINGLDFSLEQAMIRCAPGGWLPVARRRRSFVHTLLKNRQVPKARYTGGRSLDPVRPASKQVEDY